MQFIPIKTRKLNPPQDNLYPIFDQYLPKLKNGDVYIVNANNQETKLAEPYLNKQDVSFSPLDKTYETITVPPHMYFVMGDNREMSTDSRVFGFVARSDIYGLVRPLPSWLSKIVNHH